MPDQIPGSHEPDPTSDWTRTSASGSVPAAGGFGPYRFLQRLGEGGMGEVWLAEQVRPVRRQVAIKIVKAGMDTAQVVARFEAERQAVAVMDHPAIAKVFDGGTTPEGRPYFAMEYVRGESITSYCDRQRLPIPERLELFMLLCEGVQHAHQKGIIHRDLKPSNVLVSVADDRPVPRIIDFGIAKAMAQPLTERPLYTELGGFLGTPEYMSPEQAELTPIDVDTRSDVYSLGVILYELLSGSLPFDSEALRRSGIDEIRKTIREKDPPPPSARVTPSGAEAAERRRMAPEKLPTALRGDLDWITMKALEKDRTRRYQTANALVLDVRRHLSDEPVLAGPPSATYRARKFARRHRVGVAAVATLAFLVVAFSAVMTVQAQRIARERDRANQEAATAKQVSDFLVGLFTVSDPSEARGSALTAREILAKGATQLEGGLRDQPQVRARLQATIGGVYTGLGLYADAERLLGTVWQSQKHLLGEDHAETLATANRLANALWYQDRYDQAEPLYRDIVARRTRLLGADHPDTLRASFDLASTQLALKKWTEFETFGRDVLDRQRRVLGNTHADTLGSLTNLQYFYYHQKRYAEALPVCVEVYEGWRRLHGEDHPETLNSLHNLATIYDALDRVGDAEPLYKKALDGERRVLGDDHPRTNRTREMLSTLYGRQRRHAEAEVIALAAYAGYTKGLGAAHDRTQGVITQLVDLYTASSQPAKAAEWRAKLTKK